MSIRRLSISNLLGISAIELTIDPSGALIEGGNAKGKTTIMRALKAALDGAGISGDAVRRGETAAEIVIDLDHDTVRRRISSDGKTKLDIEDAHGVPRKRPAEFLASLLGLALLDPLDLYLAKPEERRRLILRALPCTLSPEQVNRVLPPWHEPVTAADTAGHGIEALSMIRANVAGYRTALARKGKELLGDVTTARASLVVTERAASGTWPELATAQQQLDAATARRSEIDVAIRAAAAATTATAGTRHQAAKLRGRAEEMRVRGPRLPTADDYDTAKQHVNAAHAETMRALADVEAQNAVVKELRVKLALEEGRLSSMVKRSDELLDTEQQKVKALQELERRRETHEQVAADAAELEQQAAALEATVADLTGTAPTEEQAEAAARAVVEAEQLVARAKEGQRLAAEAAAARAALESAIVEHQAAAKRYEEIDAAVKALTNELPAELLAGAGEALAGISITESGIEVRDASGTSVPLEQMNTAAQMAFAVAVAKRLNDKSKILLVDGLERIDDEQRSAFVALAIEGGYQLFATRVTSGPLQVRPVLNGASS